MFCRFYQSKKYYGVWLRSCKQVSKFELKSYFIIWAINIINFIYNKAYHTNFPYYIIESSFLKNFFACFKAVIFFITNIIDVLSIVVKASISILFYTMQVMEPSFALFLIIGDNKEWVCFYFCLELLTSKTLNKLQKQACHFCEIDYP